MLFGDAPPDRPPTWHPPPANRGSFTILSTCVITLTLCIWTAIHLNIPEHHNRLERPKWDPRGWITNQQWRKVGWVVIGLFAPEMIAFTAWAQRREALIFHKKIQEIWDSQGRSSVDPRNFSTPTPAPIQDVELSQGENREQSSFEPISQTLDQDIELGINQIHLDSSPEQPGQENSGTLSASESQITADPANSATEDLSRRYQWTITHSFFVVSGGFAFDTSSLPADQKFLPGLRDRVTLNSEAVLYLAENHRSLVPNISEAAIKDKSKANALAKSIVCLQAIWFIIQCIFRLAQGLPISLLELNTFAHSICALLIYCLWWNKPLDIEEPTIIDDKSMHGICALLCYYSAFDGMSDLGRVHIEYKPECSGKPLPESLPDIPFGATWLINGKYLPGTTIRANNTYGNAMPESHWYYPRDFRRWKLAYSARKSYKIPEFAGIYDRLRNGPTNVNFEEIFALLGEEELKSTSLHDNRDGLVVLLAFTFAGLAYGALHLLAWKSPFTTPTRKMLWRISALAIAASGPALVFPILLVRAIYSIAGPKNRTYSMISNVWIVILLPFLPAYFLFYIITRFYLVVECFISLAYVPDLVFQQPRWTYYFPHIA